MIPRRHLLIGAMICFTIAALGLTAIAAYGWDHTAQALTDYAWLKMVDQRIVGPGAGYEEQNYDSDWEIRIMTFGFLSHGQTACAEGTDIWHLTKRTQPTTRFLAYWDRDVSDWKYRYPPPIAGNNCGPFGGLPFGC